MPHLRRLKRARREYIICGDWNIAHKPIDLEELEMNQKNSASCRRSAPGWDRLWSGKIHRRVSFAGAGAGSLTLVVELADRWAKNVGWRIHYQI